MLKKIILAVSSAFFFLIFLEVISYPLEKIFVRRSLEKAPLVSDFLAEIARINFSKQKAKAGDEMLVYLLGGSSMSGIPEKSFGIAAQMQYWLPKFVKGRRVEVVNLASRNFSSFQCRLLAVKALENNPDFFVVMTGQEEFLQRKSHGDFSFLLSKFAVCRLFSLLLEKGRNYELFYEKFDQNRPIISKDSKFYAAKIKAYRENIDFIIEAASRRKTAVIFLNSPLNLGSWAPLPRNSVKNSGKYLDENKYFANLQLIASAFDGKDYMQAVELSQKNLEKYPNDTSIRYFMGKSMLAIKEIDAAKELLRDALLADPSPRRSDLRLNEILASAVAKRQDKNHSCLLLDTNALLQESSSDGISNLLTMNNRVNTNLSGSAIICREILKKLVEQNLIKDVEHILPRAKNYNDFLQAYLAKKFSLSELSKSLCRYLCSAAVLNMQEPYNNFAAAIYHLNKASELCQNEIAFLANYACLQLIQNNTRGASAYLQRLAKSNPKVKIHEVYQQAPLLQKALRQRNINLDDYFSRKSQMR